MAVMIESSELLINKACYLLEENQDFSLASSIAKYYSSESAVKISNDAVQICHLCGGICRIKQIKM